MKTEDIIELEEQPEYGGEAEFRFLDEEALVKFLRNLLGDDSKETDDHTEES